MPGGGISPALTFASTRSQMARLSLKVFVSEYAEKLMPAELTFSLWQPLQLVLTKARRPASSAKEGVAQAAKNRIIGRLPKRRVTSLF